jgi:membrane protein
VSSVSIRPVARQVVDTVRKRQLGERAAAATYFGFTSMPAILLVTVGVFASVAGRGAVDAVVDRMRRVVPADALSVVDRVLTSTVGQAGTWWLVLVGIALALWSATGAMTVVMNGLNAANACDETRGFLRRRLVAASMILLAAAAIALVSLLLLAGPWLSGALGKAVGWESWLDVAWSIAQWPILFFGLLGVASALLVLGPDRTPSDRAALVVGALATVVGWLVVSAALSFYLTRFGSYDRAWGPLAAVIVALVWLWASAYTLLVGGAVAAAFSDNRDASISTADASVGRARREDDRPSHQAVA